MLTTETQHQTTVPFRLLRQHVGIRLFKHVLLAEADEIGKPQFEEAQAAFQSLAGAAVDFFDQRTWASWFSATPPRMRSDVIRLMDLTLERQLNQATEVSRSTKTSPRFGFLSELIDGGLAARLLQPTKSKKALITFQALAIKYQPLWPAALLIDAIESAALAQGNGDVDWIQLKSLAARRVLALLHEQWNPRHGTIFKKLSSATRLQWESANFDEKKVIRQEFAQFKPDLFEKAMTVDAKPNWSLTGVSPNIATEHAHYLLLGLAGDPEFLVADRFDAWYLDLISASIAMYALAWTDAKVTFAIRPIQSELLFWRGMNMLFFSDGPSDIQAPAVRVAFELTGGNWSARTYEVLMKARNRFHEQLASVELTPELIRWLMSSGQRQKPILYSARHQDI